MKATPEELCILYAKNRIELSELKTKISDLVQKHKYGIELDAFRYNWYKLTSEEDIALDGRQWVSWMAAIEEYDSDGKESLPEQIELAKMLDRKKKLKKEAGRLKTRIYAVGKSLII